MSINLAPSPWILPELRFQRSQLRARSQRTAEQWHARCARVALAAHLLILRDQPDAWLALLAAEREFAGGGPLAPSHRGAAAAWWLERARTDLMAFGRPSPPA